MKRDTLTLIGTLAIALAASALSTTALATDAASAPSRAGRREQMKQAREAFKERFDAADANHDGLLTKEEAQGKMPKVYEHFDEIDTEHKGAVSERDIAKWMKAQRGNRRGAAR